nr:hypothetical protein [Streptomyces sp. CMB-StM0423]
MTSFSLDGTAQLVRGIFDEFVRRMVRVGGAVHHSETRSGSPYSGFMVGRRRPRGGGLRPPGYWPR